MSLRGFSYFVFVCKAGDSLSEDSTQKPTEKVLIPSQEQVFAECSQKRILGLLAAMLPPFKSVSSFYFHLGIFLGAQITWIKFIGMKCGIWAHVAYMLWNVNQNVFRHWHHWGMQGLVPGWGKREGNFKVSVKLWPNYLAEFKSSV